MPISRRRRSTSTTPDRPPGRVWLAGADAAAVLRAYPTIDAALRRRPGIELLITVPEVEVATLRRRLPHESVAAAPARPARWARRQGVGLRLSVGALGDGDDAVPELRFADPALMSAEAILAALASTAESAPPARRNRWRGAVVRLIAGAPLVDLESLGERLGRPETILCLGNGPSSEDPALAGVAFDRLFRVNWTWHSRAVLARPDVVFTADPDLPPEGCRPVLCFPQQLAGEGIMLRHLVALRRPPSHIFLDRLPQFAADLARPPIPTNGALMLAVAAALQPHRLVVAGIDLYAHAAGRYPGDADALDGYSRLHERDCDLAVIRRALDGYRGDATILGDALKRALAGG